MDATLKQKFPDCCGLLKVKTTDDFCRREDNIVENIFRGKFSIDISKSFVRGVHLNGVLVKMIAAGSRKRNGEMGRGKRVLGQLVSYETVHLTSPLEMLIPRYMSPNDPEPIFLTSLYLLPTIKSLFITDIANCNDILFLASQFLSSLRYNRRRTTATWLTSDSNLI